MRGHAEPMGRRQHLLLALGPLAAACLGAPEPTSPAPTYGADVAPLLARSCLPCHAGAEEAAGAPALDTLEEARRHGEAMVFAVDGGLMPPGGIDRGGACQTFLGPQPFRAEDAEVLRAWVEGGMPAGEAPAPADAGAAPSVRADRIVEAALPLSPFAADEHRCFLVDLGPDAPGFLAGIRIDGGGVVHHAMVFAPPEPSAGAARALDAADAEPGWSCPGAPLGAGSLLATWVPGQHEAAFPDGAAAPLAPGPLLVQLHQHGASGVADARVSLLLVDDAPRSVRTVPVAVTDFLLPPGEADVAVVRTVPLPLDGEVLVLGVMPHLHGAGRAASLAVEGGPCLVDAPRFDFAWQELAFYEFPVPLAAGARATLSCRWDTRGRSTPTAWGESSDDEMCTVFLFVTGP